MYIERCILTVQRSIFICNQKSSAKGGIILAENQNKRLVYELLRLDRPDTPDGAAAVLLEMHPGVATRKKNGIMLKPGEYITTPTRYAEGNIVDKALELMDDDRHRLQGYVGLMAGGLPRGHRTAEGWRRIMHAHKDVRAVVGLVVDLDEHDYTDKATMRQHVQHTADALHYLFLQHDTSLPMPAIEDSGRGIHLWWIFSKAIPYTENGDSARWYTTLAGAVVQIIKALINSCPYKYDVDTQATAAYRVYNLPGSINDATGTVRQVVNDDWAVVDVDELCEAAGVTAPGEPLPPKKLKPLVIGNGKPPEVDGTAALKPIRAAETAPGKAVYLPNTATRLHSACYRVERIVAWAARRGYLITGKRNEWLSCIVSILSAGAGLQLTPADLQQYNTLLPDPLPESELAAIIATMSVYKRPMRNDTIARHLDMTAEEIAALSMVSGEGAADRPQYSTPWMAIRAGAMPDTRIQNKTRNKQRADRKAAKKKAKADAAAAKAAKIADREQKKEKARRLLAGGMSVRVVAEMTGLAKSSVQRLRDSK